MKVRKGKREQDQQNKSRKTGSPQSNARSDKKRKRHYCTFLSGLQIKRDGSSRISPRDVALEHLPVRVSFQKRIVAARPLALYLSVLYSPGSETNWPSCCIWVPKNIYSMTTPSYPLQNYHPFQGLQD